MAFNGSGTFVRLYNWVVDKGNAVPITASRMDAEQDGIATGLSNCITKDGQTTIAQNIPFNAKKITGLANGSALTDAINVGQVQDGQFTYLGTTGGAADAYTATPTPAITAYTANMRYKAKISATNLTTTPYLQISAIGTPASDAVIKKLAADKSEVAVVIGDLIASGIYEFDRNSANDAWIVANPENLISNAIINSGAINNLSLAATVGSNALTITLNNSAGDDPSTSDPVVVSFRNATLTTGTYSAVSAIAATSLVISSGSTLGTTSAVPSKIYVYALNNAGTIELGASSYRFDDNSIQSSTAEGGSGGADTSTVLYSTTSRSNVAIRLIGTITSTQTVAGTWASSPSIISLQPLPASILQVKKLYPTTSGYAASDIPWDDTIPQATEGTLFMELPFTPKSATSLLRIDVVGNWGQDVNEIMVVALFKVGTADALAAVATFPSATLGFSGTTSFTHWMVSGSTSATQFDVRAGGNTGGGGTVTFNGVAGSRKLGGVMASSITVTEYSF
jgi:hypothetical protein